MLDPRLETNSKTKSRASFPPVLLFMLAAALLMLMSLTLEPMVALPLFAFAAMAALTWQLAQRLHGELKTSSIKND